MNASVQRGRSAWRPPYGERLDDRYLDGSSMPCPDGAQWCNRAAEALPRCWALPWVNVVFSQLFSATESRFGVKVTRLPPRAQDWRRRAAGRS
jgi:hypothetical protein